MKKGYTLIELLIVITIIAILTVGGVFAIGSKIKSARDEKRKADIYDIRIGLEQYYMNEDEYPATGSLNWGGPMRDTSGSVLVSHIGEDPINDGGYKYSYRATDSDYDICAQLELEELGKLWCLHGLMKSI